MYNHRVIWITASHQLQGQSATSCELDFLHSNRKTTRSVTLLRTQLTLQVQLHQVWSQCDQWFWFNNANKHKHSCTNKQMAVVTLTASVISRCFVFVFASWSS